MRVAILLTVAILVSSLVCPPAWANNKPDCMKLTNVASSYDALRQGHTFTLALRLEAPGCILVSQGSFVVQPVAGLDIRLIGRGHSDLALEGAPILLLPDIQAVGLQEQIPTGQPAGVPVQASLDGKDCNRQRPAPPQILMAVPRVRGFHRIEILLRAVASPEIIPGTYRLKAVLNYEALEHQGTRVPRQFAFTFPIKVVPENAIVKKAADRHWQAYILLSPVLFPINLLDGLTGRGGW